MPEVGGTDANSEFADNFFELFILTRHKQHEMFIRETYAHSSLRVLLFSSRDILSLRLRFRTFEAYNFINSAATVFFCLINRYYRDDLRYRCYCSQFR